MVHYAHVAETICTISLVMNKDEKGQDNMLMIYVCMTPAYALRAILGGEIVQTAYHVC